MNELKSVSLARAEIVLDVAKKISEWLETQSRLDIGPGGVISFAENIVDKSEVQIIRTKG